MYKKDFLYWVIPIVILLLFCPLVYFSSDGLNGKIIHYENEYYDYKRLCNIAYDRLDMQRNNAILKYNKHNKHNNIFFYDIYDNSSTNIFNISLKDDQDSIIYERKQIKHKFLKKYAGVLSQRRITTNIIKPLVLKKHIYKIKLNKFKSIRKQKYVSSCNLQSITFLLPFLLLTSGFYIFKIIHKCMKFISNNNTIYYHMTLEELRILHRKFEQVAWLHSVHEIITEYLLFIIPTVISVMSGAFGDVSNNTIYFYLTFLAAPTLSYIQCIRIYINYLNNYYGITENDICKFVNNVKNTYRI